LALTFALALISALTGGVGAEQMSPGQIQDAFADGCKKGGHSYVENRDGSYQCNLRDGSTIKCTADAKCTYIPKARVVNLDDVIVSDQVVVADASPEETRPGKAGGTIVVRSNGFAKSSLIEPEPTPEP
jgi:hypothetical protein